MKAWFGLLQDVKVVDLNRLLKAHGVRLVVKKSKDWGKNVSVTAHTVGAPAKRQRIAALKAQEGHVANEDAERMAAGFGAALELTKAAVG